MPLYACYCTILILMSYLHECRSYVMILINMKRNMSLYLCPDCTPWYVYTLTSSWYLCQMLPCVALYWFLHLTRTVSCYYLILDKSNQSAIAWQYYDMEYRGKIKLKGIRIISPMNSLYYPICSWLLTII